MPLFVPEAICPLRLQTTGKTRFQPQLYLLRTPSDVPLPVDKAATDSPPHAWDVPFTVWALRQPPFENEAASRIAPNPPTAKGCTSPTAVSTTQTTGR